MASRRHRNAGGPSPTGRPRTSLAGAPKSTSAAWFHVLTVPSPSTVIVATGEDDTSVARRRVVSPSACSASTRAAISRSAASSASIQRSPGAPDQAEGEGGEEGKADDGEAGLAQRVRLDVQGEHGDGDGRHDPRSDIDRLGRGPAEVRLDDADADERDDDRERNADRVQRGRQDRLGPEQHDRQRQQRAVAALVERDEDEDRRRDDRRLQGDGQDRFARWGEVEREGPRQQGRRTAREEEAAEPRALSDGAL